MRVKFLLLVLCAYCYSGKAQSDIIELSGDILHLAIPGAAFTSTVIWKEDKYKGSWEFIKAAGVSTIATYGLKYIVDKQRPNGDRYAFPSGHASRAFVGAAFIQRKWGWKYGAPAYLLAGYTGWTRVEAGKHDYWDILGGAAVGIASSYLFATPYKKRGGGELSFGKQNQQYVLNFRYSF